MTKKDFNMEILKKFVGETINERLVKANLKFQENEIRKYILQEFTKIGKAPTSIEIKKNLNIQNIEMVNKTIEKLEQFDLLQRRGNEIISSYPFFALQTRHKIIFEDGMIVYALCATDAVGIHFTLKKNITIVSKCPECGNDIKIIVKNGKIRSYDPKGIIEFLSFSKMCGCIANRVCPFINFFCSEEHLKDWRAKNPEYKSGAVFSIYNVLKQGKLIYGNLLK